MYVCIYIYIYYMYMCNIVMYVYIYIIYIYIYIYILYGRMAYNCYSIHIIIECHCFFMSQLGVCYYIYCYWIFQKLQLLLIFKLHIFLLIIITRIQYSNYIYWLNSNYIYCYWILTHIIIESLHILLLNYCTYYYWNPLWVHVCIDTH